MYCWKKSICSALFMLCQVKKPSTDASSPGTCLHLCSNRFRDLKLLFLPVGCFFNIITLLLFLFLVSPIFFPMYYNQVNKRYFLWGCAPTQSSGVPNGILNLLFQPHCSWIIISNLVLLSRVHHDDCERTFFIFQKKKCKFWKYHSNEEREWKWMESSVFISKKCNYNK